MRHVLQLPPCWGFIAELSPVNLEGPKTWPYMLSKWMLSQLPWRSLKFPELTLTLCWSFCFSPTLFSTETFLVKTAAKKVSVPQPYLCLLLQIHLLICLKYCSRPTLFLFSFYSWCINKTSRLAADALFVALEVPCRCQLQVSFGLHATIPTHLITEKDNAFTRWFTIPGHFTNLKALTNVWLGRD